MHPAHAEYFVQLKHQLENAASGECGRIVSRAAAFFSCREGTIYRRLAEVGWESGRKNRADRGRRGVDEGLAELAAGMVKAATRANGKRTLSIKRSVKILEDNGMGVINTDTGEVVMPRPETVARAMRDYGVHPEQIKRGSPAIQMRALHPNHTWEMDASVCILFYLPRGKVRIMEENKYYKNKPQHLEKAARDKVIRWIVTDH